MTAVLFFLVRLVVTLGVLTSTSLLCAIGHKVALLDQMPKGRVRALHLISFAIGCNLAALLFIWVI